MTSAPATATPAAASTRAVGRAEQEGFAARLRAATADAHSAAESSTFMAELLGGRLAPAAHGALLRQVRELCAVLEGAEPRWRDDPALAPVLDPRLHRLPALEADLAAVLGPAWRDEPVLPATRRYAARLAQVAPTWAGGFLAHHYLRYLGDLSGGQVVRALLGRTFGWGDDHLAAYAFDVGSPKRYRDGYRAHLDALPSHWDDAELARVVAEVRDGYRLNEELFADLSGRVHRWRR